MQMCKQIQPWCNKYCKMSVMYSIDISQQQEMCHSTWICNCDVSTNVRLVFRLYFSSYIFLKKKVVYANHKIICKILESLKRCIMPQISNSVFYQLHGIHSHCITVIIHGFLIATFLFLYRCRYRPTVYICFNGR